MKGNFNTHTKNYGDSLIGLGPTHMGLCPPQPPAPDWIFHCLQQNSVGLLTSLRRRWKDCEFSDLFMCL